MQIFVNSVERLNSPVYTAPPCIINLIFSCFGTKRLPFVVSLLVICFTVYMKNSSRCDEILVWDWQWGNGNNQWDGGKERENLAKSGSGNENGNEQLGTGGSEIEKTFPIDHYISSRPQSFASRYMLPWLRLPVPIQCGVRAN